MAPSKNCHSEQSEESAFNKAQEAESSTPTAAVVAERQTISRSPIENEGIHRWYAVSCKPRQETVAQENLQRQGFHVYLPRIRIRHRRRGQWLDVVEALFPRYIFIRIDPLQRSLAPVRSTRGVVGLVRFGGQPAVVPDAVMAALAQREDAASGLHQDKRPPFSAGEAVKFVDGPLAGMEGVFTEQDGEKRVIVLLELLGKANRVRVNRDWIARAA